MNDSSHWMITRSNLKLELLKWINTVIKDYGRKVGKPIKMSKNKKDKLSVFLSLVLRHQPEAAGITLDEHGWADVRELLQGINDTGRGIDMGMLEEIVRTDEKGRYRFNEDKTLIRANQGHSIPVDVELTQTEPPFILYHGTAKRFEAAILKEGLKPMSRLYVHLSEDKETAAKVGKRHGSPVVFEVASDEMYKDGVKFFLSHNGVWLTEKVAPGYLKLLC